MKWTDQIFQRNERIFGMININLKYIFIFILIGFTGVAACQTSSTEMIEASLPTDTILAATQTLENVSTETLLEIPEDMIKEEIQPEEGKLLADVISVQAFGESNQYTFSVGISSPDTGCEQYADWWEVISSEGELIYRRILLHSHVAEQPFVRSGGPVEIEPETEVILRAHLNPGGYGGKAFKGTVGSGFKEVDLAEDFRADLENHDPLPSGCDF
jgi:hypothetical protein